MDNPAFRKLWPDEFYEDRNPLEERPHVQNMLDAMLSEIEQVQDERIPTLGSLGPQPVNPDPAEERGEPNRLQLFLGGYENDVPSIQEEEIAEYCRGVHPSVLKQREKDPRATAWLDDRLYSFYCTPRLPQTAVLNSKTGGPTLQKSTNPYRKYNSPLSASSLYGFLMDKRFGHSELPDADRRLISIPSLSPQFVYALTETAPAHQAPALTDALFKHLALQTCMSVHMSNEGYNVFQLRFHMPFYALRERRPVLREEGGVSCKPRRTWRDVSFIAGSLGIYDSHIAFTVCGVADRRWVAYAFSDTDYDEDKQMDESESDYDSVVVDQIAADGARTIDANIPIWNPREYYLTIVSRRLNQIVGEWARLIRKFEKANDNYTDRLLSVKTPSQGLEDKSDVMDTFDRTQKTLLILGDLRATLSGMNEAWNQFSSVDGDIGYFRHIGNVSEVCQRQCQRLIRDIKGRCDESKDLQRRLDDLVRRYKMTASILELRLTLESNNTAKLSGSIAELMVAWVSPVAIVSAFFAIPEPFGNFNRNAGSFFVGTFVVFTVMQFLIIFSKGHVQPKRIRQKTQEWTALFQQRTLRLRETVERSRRRGIFRADTDATLVEPEGVAANA